MAVIKVRPWGSGQGEFVLIDEETYNPEFHVRIDEPTPVQEEEPTPVQENAVQKMLRARKG